MAGPLRPSDRIVCPVEVCFEHLIVVGFKLVYTSLIHGTSMYLPIFVQLA